MVGRSSLAIAVAIIAVIVAALAAAAWAGYMGTAPLGGVTPANRICLKDLANRTVCISGEAKRVVSLWPEATRIVIALRAGDRLVGVSIYDKRDPIMLKVWPRLGKLPAVGTTDAPNIEEIRRLKPDVILADARRGDALDKLQELAGVPVVGVRINVGVEGRFSYKAFEIVGKILGGRHEKRGEELAKYLEDKLDAIRKRVSQIPLGKRLRVYIAFARSPLITLGLADPAESAGLINVALSPGRVWYPVNLEQVARWNPDIIAVHVLSKRLGNYTVETLLRDPAWRSVKAVREGRVYNVILGYVGWYPAMTVVNTLQLAKIAYPQLFKDIDVVKVGNEVFKKLYGVDNLFTEIAREFGLYTPG